MLIIAKGTVLVTIGTKDGFILAADSRQIRGDQVFSDKKQKIFRITDYIACSLGGRIQVSAEKENLEYALDRELIEYSNSAKTALTVQQHTEQIAEAFYGKVAPIYSKFPGVLDDWLRKTPGRDTFITVHVVGYGKKTQPRWFTVSFPPRWESKFGAPQLARPIVKKELFQGFGILPGGWADIVDSLMREGESYPDCRNLEPLKNFYRKRLDRKRFYRKRPMDALFRMTIEEGVELARALTQCTIQHCPPNAGVGGEVQMAVVERKEGFRWIARLSDDWE